MTHLSARLTSLLGNVLAGVATIAMVLAAIWCLGLAMDNHTARHDPSSQYYVAPRH